MRPVIRLARFGWQTGLATWNRSNAVPRAAIRAVTESLLSVMLINLIFAYLVYGVAFFGLVTAEQ